MPPIPSIVEVATREIALPIENSSQGTWKILWRTSHPGCGNLGDVINIAQVNIPSGLEATYFNANVIYSRYSCLLFVPSNKCTLPSAFCYGVAFDM